MCITYAHCAVYSAGFSNWFKLCQLSFKQQDRGPCHLVREQHDSFRCDFGFFQFGINVRNLRLLIFDGSSFYQ